MWKSLLFLILLITQIVYGKAKVQDRQVASNEHFISDIETTYKKVLKEESFEGRRQLVDQLRERAVEMQQNLIKKKERTDADSGTIFHIDIFEDLYHQLNTTDQDQCVTSAQNLRFSLYRTRPEDEVFPFERSLYNLFGKMCSSEFSLLEE